MGSFPPACCFLLRKGGEQLLEEVVSWAAESCASAPCGEGLQEAGAALGVWSGSKLELLMSGGVPKLRCESQAARD